MNAFIKGRRRAVAMLVLLPVSARPEGGQAQKASLQIPESIRIEHEAIHTALVEATKAPGTVGAAAKELAAVLHPHFVREEEIALPENVTTVAGLRAHLMARGGAWQSVLAHGKTLRVAVNHEMAQPSTPIGAGDEVAFFPPVTGG